MRKSALSATVELLSVTVAVVQAQDLLGGGPHDDGPHGPSADNPPG